MKFVTVKRLLNIFLYKNSAADDFQLRCQSVDKLQILFCGVYAAFFVFPLTCAAEKHIVSENPLIKRVFKDTGVVLAGHNNRLPPVAD